MECIILMGIQASGKSTFYREHFFATHMRINLDMLKTRHREWAFVQTCIQTGQPFVVDNTNPAKADRAKYIEAAKAAGYLVIGYYFEPDFGASVERNDSRHGKARVPLVAIKSTISKLNRPEPEEGFDELYSVLASSGAFRVEKQS